MKLKKELAVLIGVTKIDFMILLTAIYGIGYGILMTAIDGWAWDKYLSTTLFWTLLYGYIFVTIGIGIGLSTVIYYCISFGQTRKTAIRIWSYSIVLNLLFGILFGGAYIFFALREKDIYTYRPTFFHYISNTMPQTSDWMVYAVGLGFIVSLGLLLHAFVSLLTVLFLRYNWRVMVIALIFGISGIFLGIGQYVLIFRTGQSMNWIIGIQFGLAALMLGSVVNMAAKVEVKN